MDAWSLPPRPPRIETVLLDAGGVLLDLDYAYVRRLLEARGRDADDGALGRAEALARREIDRRVRAGGTTGEAWRDYFRVMLGAVGLPIDHREPVIDSLWEAHERVGLWTVASAGGVEAVRTLRAKGYRLGVVSNAEGRVARDLESAGYRGLFETVVDSHLVGVAKPDPEIFRIALGRMSVAADSAVFVGDVPSVDVAGAASAGIAPLLLDRHDLYPDVPAPRLRSMGELDPWLEGRAA